jgi:hypothetical protein
VSLNPRPVVIVNRLIERELRQLIDEAQQIRPAMAARLLRWESSGHGGGSSREPSSRDRCGGEDSRRSR